MSSYLTGGGRAAYRLESLNLDCIIKSPLSSTSWTSNNSSSTSSPSSTLSESTNSPLAISTRKPRTPRKRPNQTYNEAAAILSTACPKIFTTKHITKPQSKLVKSHDIVDKKSQYLFEHPDLINVPFQVIDNSEFLLNPPVLERTRLANGFNPFEKPCLSPGEINSQVQFSSEICYESQENFEAQSIVLDEEVTEEGIDSIMRISTVMENESTEYPKTHNDNVMQIEKFAYGYPVMGFGFDFGHGMRREFRAFRNVDDGDWWRFPTVNVADLTPKIHLSDGAKASHVEKKAKKKKKKVENKKLLSDLIKDNNSCSEVKAKNHENATVASHEKANEEEHAITFLPKPNAGLLLKLNYEEVLNNWADKASPFSGDELAGNDVQARLEQIDLFSSENGGLIREASVLRYKEKRRTRLFSKKIRYQVRKVNADRRPRMKGRFVRTPNSSEE